MNLAAQIFGNPLPDIHIGDWLASAVDWITVHWATFLDFIVWVIESILYDNIVAGLAWVPPLVLALLFALLAFALRGWRFGLAALVGMLLIQTFPSADMWVAAMQTLTLVVIAAVMALAIALPLGVLAAKNQTVSLALKPVMDFMQTMPAFVWLLPAIFFFSIGATAGWFSTIIFCMPPAVRLTELGIRQVDPEMVECGRAFGAPPREILSRIQIPLAMPTIMAGINQVIMLALSMVVIAGMVGAGGLGGLVIEGINRLQFAKGFEAGLGVVIVAIYLDRVTGALGARSAVARAKAKTARGG